MNKLNRRPLRVKVGSHVKMHGFYVANDPQNGIDIFHLVKLLRKQKKMVGFYRIYARFKETWREVIL